MAVIAEGGPAGRGLAEYMKWRNRRKLLKGLGRNRPTMNTPAIPLPKDVMERGEIPAIPLPTVTGAMPGTIPKDVMRPRGIPNALNIGQSGPPRRNSYRHHPGGYVIPANASLTPESQAVRDYQGFVSEGSPHTYANYPMTSAGPDAIARQVYERSRNVIEPFSWYKGNEGWFTKRPISDKLKSMMRKETGAAMTPNEMKMFMGMPVKGRQQVTNRADDTAEWNAPEGIFPRFLIDQLINSNVLTEDDVIDLEAPDGDSWKILPRGLGRMDELRRA